MFEYINAKDAKGSAFVILDTPIKVYKPSGNYYKEKAYEEYDFLPKSITCYLLDDSKAPYETVTDEEGNEVSNLVTYVDGEAKHLDYNFFNFPKPAERDLGDGNVEEYRRKWLDVKLRANVKFVKPIKAKVWDTTLKKEVEKEVEYAKMDIPITAFAKFESGFETVKDAKEAPDMAISEVEVSIDFDNAKAAADMYSVKVKPTKANINPEEELVNFEKQKQPFIEPDNPFLD